MSSASPPPSSPAADAPQPSSESPPLPPPPPPEPPPASPPPPEPPITPPPPIEPPSAPPPSGTPPPPPPAESPPPANTSNVPPPEINSPPPPVGTPPPQPSPVVNPPPPPLSTPPSSSPPPTSSPPPRPPSLSPPRQPSTPPPQSLSPPSQPSSPPLTASPPSQPSVPPPVASPPPPDLPATSPPPPTPSEPPISPPGPPINPPPTPESSPPPPPQQPRNAPPPPTTTPPAISPPPRTPPENSPPPPTPPENSPPPPSVVPPQNFPPPPVRRPPVGSPPPPPRSPPNSEPPPSPSPPPPLSPPPRLSPPPVLERSPPPPLVVYPPRFTPPIPLVPPANTNTDNSTSNAMGNSQSDGRGIGTGGTVAIVLVLGFLLLGVFGAAACCVWRRKKKTAGQNGNHILPTSIVTSPELESIMSKAQMSASSNGSGSGYGIGHSASESGGLGHSRSGGFAYDELVAATNGFPQENLLGEGGFGSVYKGRLADGREVAVKELKIGGGQGEREFRSEVEIISRIHHRHLVSLIGYCISSNRRLLVYEYVPNNTLYFHLHGQGMPVMNWVTRVKVATGAARGIAYLHEDCHPRIIHRDIKSSNILLENNFEARVSDFGLAKLAMDAHTHITTRVMGTFGYMAPEYASSGKLTEKSDVYSFGVVLLELITGRKPVDMSQPLGEESLVEWARPLLSHAMETQEFGALVDPRLEENYIEGEMFRMIEAAAACVRHSLTKRPKMGQIVRVFDSMAASDLSNGMKVGESEIFNSAQQSEEIRLFQRMAFGSQDYSTDFFSQNSCSSEGNRISSPKD